MRMSAVGGLRPQPLEAFSEVEEQTVLAACPGAAVATRDERSAYHDPVWGGYESLLTAWAVDPLVRFTSATGGVLTALAQHLLEQDEIAFVLHVGADAERPLRNRWVMSETKEDVMAFNGSRYAPVAPLAGLAVALEREEPFAIVAKPCDLNAVAGLAKYDQRVDALCRFRLALVCGGQSRLSKTLDLLERFDVPADAVKEVRYRGNGNPGPTRVTTHEGIDHCVSYNDLWADESSWNLESRCTICPDALGEAADCAALDIWPGGGPTGEDEGFNGLVVRSSRGAKLLQSAFDHKALDQGAPLTIDELNDCQPHQVRKKYALRARLRALEEAGKPVPDTTGLRLTVLSKYLSPAQRDEVKQGTRVRIRRGRFTERVKNVDP